MKSRKLSLQSAPKKLNIPKETPRHPIFAFRPSLADPCVKVLKSQL